MGRLNLPETGPDFPDHGATDSGAPQHSAPDQGSRDQDVRAESVADLQAPQLGELAEIYGRPVPDTALVLEHYLERGRVPLRDPEHPEDVVTVDLPVAAHEFGSDLDATCHYLHRLHAMGELTVAADGTVEFGPAVCLG